MSFIVSGNWKMNKGPKESQEFFSEFKNPNSNIKTIFFVPAVNLLTAAQALEGQDVGWGPQNVYFKNNGAFTGENSPEVMAEIGAPYGLVGHSERRTLFGETDEETCQKVKALQEVGISPILCIGETLEERKSGATNDVLKRQLENGLDGVEVQKELHVAYEP
ncbi:MAG: triosephosphate isomerase, partial [Bdellovibrionales bacterium]|nr:triose-phosphate isomerase [Bdellovibrionales bacterium]NQZ20218.1 triosephosphate isomerase [Bdellovibrionales bacterium]